MKILLTLSYDGTNYKGYQLQGENPTVALMLNRAAYETFGFRCNITGCSRTDSGVHALGFCATAEPSNTANEINIPIEKIPMALNTHLPCDIAVLSAERVDDSFHPRYSAVKKEYIYKIHDSKIRNPFYRNRVLEYGKKISDEALLKMQIAAEYFLGTHYFDAFMASGSKTENTARTVFDVCIKRIGDIVEFRICADGFLYNMVRIIVGTLLSVESGKIKETDIKDIISSRKRSMAGATAKPDGLYLKKIFYNY